MLFSSSLPLTLSCKAPKFHLVPLRPLVGLRPPSHFFIYSLSLPVLSKTQLQKAFSSCGCHERSDQSRSSQGYMAWCGWHEILIQRCITVFFLSIFLDLSSTASESALFLCSKVDSRSFWSVVVLNERISQKRRSHGRIEESNRIIILSLPTELRERPVLIIYSDSYMHVYLDWFSLLWYHCALKSASVENFFTLSLSLCIFILSCPKHNTRRRSLSMLVPRKEWPVSQLTGVYGMLRVSRNEWPDTQLTRAESMLRVPRNFVSPFTTVYLLSNFFDLSSGASELFQFIGSNVESGSYWFVIVQNWRIPPKMTIPLKNYQVE